jgi:hypothetical protein
MRGSGLLGWQDEGESFVPTPGGLLDGLPAADTGSSLHMFMEPKDIATIPGLPQHVYDDAARYEQASSTATDSRPTGYVSHLDQVSLTPWDGNSAGLDLSAPASQSPDNPSKPGEKYEQGANGLGFLHHGINLWNAQNALLGLHFGPDGAELLKKYSEPVAKGLVPLENGLEAVADIKTERK